MALTMVPFAFSGDALACDQVSPINNATINCSDTTRNNNGVGFGTLLDTGNTINVTSTGLVSGSTDGIDLGSGAINNNSGTISGQNNGIQAGGVISLVNSGTISGATAVNAQNGISTVTNSLNITGSNIGVFLGTGTVNNLAGGTIEGTNSGVGLSGGTVNNGGTILGNTAIAGAFDALTINNTGKIAGQKGGVIAEGATTINNSAGATIQVSGANNAVAIGSFVPNPTNTVTVTNAGTIQANATGGIGIQAQTVNITSNSGTISADSTAVLATGNDVSGVAALTVNNSGKITSTNGRAIESNGTTGSAVVNNSGTISASIAISAENNVTVTNSGMITSANGNTINSDLASVTVNNSGIISGSNVISAEHGVTVTNSGTIHGTGEVIAWVSGNGSITNLAGGMIVSNGSTAISTGVNGTSTINNAGTITGSQAIVSSGSAVTITNSGTIASTQGATGTAISLSSAVNTLNIKNGSVIIGKIDMGDNTADVVNIDAPPSVAKGVSMLSRAASTVAAAITQQLTSDFKGVIDIVSGASTSGQPAVTVNGITASVDPTAMAQQDRTLMDFTGGMSSMVQGRLAGAATGSGPMAMSYAMDDGKQMLSKTPVSSWNAPVTVWSSMFGASRSQNGTDTTLNSTSSVFGGVIGVDRRIQPNWLVGAFVGGGSGSLNVDLSSQKINTDYVSGGFYSRYEWASQFFDATLQAGSMNNRSSRLVQNTLTGAGENATASYNGWFISPEVAYGYRLAFGDLMVTPTLRARYVAGSLDGYNETGSAQTLSVGSRTLQDFEERAEVEVARTGLFGDPSLKGWLRGGAIALQRVGDTTVNVVLIGQSLSFVTPGKNTAVGGVGSVGVDYHLTPNVALFGSLEGMWMSDESKVGSAKGGVKVAF
jgi:outer membrane autotransporter protein